MHTSRQTGHAVDALPALDSGVTLLRGAESVGESKSGVQDRRTELAALALAELDRRDGPVRWVDARNHVSTHALTDGARRPRVLERVLVARAFTAHQHHSLVRQLVADAARPTALVVAPAVDDLYADEDLLTGEAERLRDATLSTLHALAEACDVPVLVTASDDEIVAEYAHEELAVEETRFGPRFEGAGGETTAYWSRGGWQTTVPYWVDIYGAVEATEAVETETEPALPEVIA
ncbi:hypothetical protein [Halobacterium zhouii]|uniref:hypothetical protein n=1 Tax=Halobacterium zhouii TaxID=2902624 RepID=UPI001E4AF033|nr:hypothetical protein [Halobacterium zhouii]